MRTSRHGAHDRPPPATRAGPFSMGRGQARLGPTAAGSSTTAPTVRACLMAASSAGSMPPGRPAARPDTISYTVGSALISSNSRCRPFWSNCRGGEGGEGDPMRRAHTPSSSVRAFSKGSPRHAASSPMHHPPTLAAL